MPDISRDILIQASEGNIEAFEKIYKATSDFVYSLAFRITGSRGNAEEVTQDVFLKIYKNLKRFQFRSSFRTWVYRITVNTAVNTYKKTSKQMRLRENYAAAIRSQSVCSATEETINKKDSETLLASLLEALNPDQRACLILREIEGLNYKEISQALKININTVRSRLKRAREKLLTLRKEVVKNEL